MASSRLARRRPREFSETDVDLFRILGATVEAALARASRESELKRQNERLDQFASVVAHDLRNPLTVAMGFLEVAAETGDPEHFAKVETAHDRIERLIEDLLTLARGETTIDDVERIDIAEISREAWGYVDTSAATMDVEDDTPIVAGDPGRLSHTAGCNKLKEFAIPGWRISLRTYSRQYQLFENLFRNAVEHGGEDVTITVGKRADGRFYVADDGEGIPPENRETVFDHGVTTNEDGTGFSLSIVEDIAKAHGWTVSVGESVDDGARFDFDTTE